MINVNCNMHQCVSFVGPLFSFDVHDDIRLINDATVEKDEVRIELSVTMFSNFIVIS